MDRPDLRAVIAVAETGSFTAAAEQLGVTQPAISRRIKDLESELNVRLFDRLGRDIRPTDAARLLLPKAREILLSMLDAETLMASVDDEVTGTLRLATSHHIGLHRLAPALQAFTAKYPDVRLDIRFEDSEEAHALVRAAESELAVVTLDPNGPGTLAYQPIWRDPLVFCAAVDHPLSTASNLNLAQLADYPCVLPDLATYTGRIVSELFASHGIRLQPSMATNYLETIAMLVNIGVGWSALPATMMTERVCALAPGEALSESLPARMLGCVTNPKRPLSNTVRSFIDLLVANADSAVLSMAPSTSEQ